MSKRKEKIVNPRTHKKTFDTDVKISQSYRDGVIVIEVLAMNGYSVKEYVLNDKALSIVIQKP